MRCILRAMASTKHKTHVSGQAPFGKHALRSQPSNPFGARSGSERAHEDYVRFSVVVPDPDERRRLLGVSAAVEEAWSEGRDLRSLRKHRKTLSRLIRDREAP
jgi:hypothetical protein